MVRGAREVAADKWPADGLCYRGGGLPDASRGFFCVGVQVMLPAEAAFAIPSPKAGLPFGLPFPQTSKT